jgi:hypothetical protein
VVAVLCIYRLVRALETGQKPASFDEGVAHDNALNSPYAVDEKTKSQHLDPLQSVESRVALETDF